MKSSSTDVKQLIGKVLMYISVTGGDGNGQALQLPRETLRLLVPALVMGTKEKNTMVKVASEQAIVVLLRLRRQETLLEVCPCFCFYVRRVVGGSVRKKYCSAG